MYNHNKAQLSKNRVHISWDILYVYRDVANVLGRRGIGNLKSEIRFQLKLHKILYILNHHSVVQFVQSIMTVVPCEKFQTGYTTELNVEFPFRTLNSTWFR